jgi:aminopeptidase N
MSGRVAAASVAAFVAVALVLAGCTRATFSPARTAGPSASPSADAGGLAGGAKDGVGSDGIGDPYLPKAGNGGYDVASYDLDLRYQPKDDTLTGTATITATATADLSQFNLDLKDLAVQSATVDGAPARTRASGTELTVTPTARIASGARFVTEIRYGGVPKPYQEPALGEIGFLHTNDGAIAIGEPHVAASWYPVNDHPRDKATYTVTIAAPTDVVALSNGVLKEKTTAGGFTSWTWVESKPMASYLATVVIGRYRLVQDTHDGKPVVTAVHASLPTRIDEAMARTPEIVDFLESKFGPYPFDAMGGIVVSDGRIRFALENQSRPIYGQAFFDGGSDGSWVIVHEIAHQWYGDSVSVENWNEIWLNEGFATYAEWLWEEGQGSRTVQGIFDQLHAVTNSPVWRVPPGEPGLDDLFSDSVYTRGGLTLHALRMTVGDEAFFTIIKTWAAEQAHGNATTAEFIALAERISGRQLDRLFQDWLYEAKRPSRPGR